MVHGECVNTTASSLSKGRASGALKNGMGSVSEAMFTPTSIIIRDSVVIVASTTDFSVRTEGSNPSFRPTCWAVDVQTEILQQLSSLTPWVCRYTECREPFREERRGSFNLDRPSRLSRTRCFRPRVQSLYPRLHWMMTSRNTRQVHLRNVGLRNNVRITSCAWSMSIIESMGVRKTIILHLASDFANQTVLAREGLHVLRDDGDVASLKVNLVSMLRGMIFAISSFSSLYVICMVFTGCSRSQHGPQHTRRCKAAKPRGIGASLRSLAISSWETCW